MQSLRTDDWVLTFLGRDDADVVYPIDAASNGDPYYWSYWGETARIYPTLAVLKLFMFVDTKIRQRSERVRLMEPHLVIFQNLSTF